MTTELVNDLAQALHDVTIPSLAGVALDQHTIWHERAAALLTRFPTLRITIPEPAPASDHATEAAASRLEIAVAQALHIRPGGAFIVDSNMRDDLTLVIQAARAHLALAGDGYA